MTMITEQEQFYVDSLPARRNYGKPWHATRFSPCPLLLKCSRCSEYKLISDFYIKRNSKKVSRRDILGTDRQCACISCYAKNFANQDLQTRLYYGAKNRAKHKGIEFKLSIGDIVIPEKCPVLGVRLKSGAGNGTQSVAKLETSPTLDRVDNSKGYTPDNICVISLRANNLKRDASLYELECLAYHMAHPPESKPRDATSVMNAAIKKNIAGKSLSKEQQRYVSRDYKNIMLQSARGRRRLYDFDESLTVDDFAVPEFCPALGIKLKPSVGLGLRKLDNFSNSPSIDRIDCRKGYQKDNIQVLSFRANCLKRDASLWEIKALVNYMKDFQNGNMWQAHKTNDTTEPDGGDV